MKLLMMALMARYGVAIPFTGWGTFIRGDDFYDGGTAISNGNRCVFDGNAAATVDYFHWFTLFNNESSVH